MKRTTIVHAVFALALLVLQALPANAQFFMTFVASNGGDANACDTPATACRHFSRALAQTNPAGEITCVDNANYFEPATVTIAITVTFDCQHAGDFPNFVINGTGITVTLRNFDMSNTGNGPAVEFKNGAALILQNVHISNEVGVGSAIRFAPAANAQLIVSDCLINSNPGVGILTKPPSGVQASFTIQRTTIQGNQYGIAADGTNGGSIQGMVRDSAVTGNSQAGIITQAAGANVTVSVDNVSVTSNGTGLWAQDGTAILARRSFITGNGTGVQANGSGAVFSYGDNSLNANTGANGAFSAQVGLK
jgi:hypothetical protein